MSSACERSKALNCDCRPGRLRYTTSSRATSIATATAFIASFKNTQTCGRTVEAQQVWTGILNASGPGA